MNDNYLHPSVMPLLSKLTLLHLMYNERTSLHGGKVSCLLGRYIKSKSWDIFRHSSQKYSLLRRLLNPI